ncbi:SEC-C metal-binding domain-containing protein [Candidatus Korobacter versatilis]
MSFEVLLLEFDNPQHPWVYCVAPEVSRDVFPALLHIREDRSIWFRGRYIPGLCVYSASIFKFESWPSKSVQVLDQTATYLGKLVIWLRTRRLFHLNSGVVLYTPAPGEQVRDTEPRINRNFPGIAKQLLPITRAWRGVWPGGVAPFGPAGHFQTIAPQEECWCGSGETYGNCHRRQEASVLGNTGDGTSPN